MKRKTNLFYLDGQDSKFITFGNYTESLTGNFLSTDTKLYPSRFLCLKITETGENSAAGLSDGARKQLVKYLTGYYENKMTVLRDMMLKDNKNLEHRIMPLNYLLEALFKIKSLNANEILISDEPIFSYGMSNFNVPIYYAYNDVVSIEYVSNITEQDYNGTFTDTICNVDLNNFTNVSYVFKNQMSFIDDDMVRFSSPISYVDNNVTLWGWEHGINSYYTDVNSIPDSIDGIPLSYLVGEDYSYNYLSKFREYDDSSDSSDSSSSSSNYDSSEYIPPTVQHNLYNIFLPVENDSKGVLDDNSYAHGVVTIYDENDNLISHKADGTSYVTTEYIDNDIYYSYSFATENKIIKIKTIADKVRRRDNYIAILNEVHITNAENDILATITPDTEEPFVFEIPNDYTILGNEIGNIFIDVSWEYYYLNEDNIPVIAPHTLVQYPCSCTEEYRNEVIKTKNNYNTPDSSDSDSDYPDIMDPIIDIDKYHKLVNSNIPEFDVELIGDSLYQEAWDDFIRTNKRNDITYFVVFKSPVMYYKYYTYSYSLLYNTYSLNEIDEKSAGEYNSLQNIPEYNKKYMYNEEWNSFCYLNATNDTKKIGPNIVNTDSYTVVFKSPNFNYDYYSYSLDTLTKIDINKFEYNTNSFLNILYLTHVDVPSIQFNCVIPLYDVVNINFKGNFNNIADVDSIDLWDTTNNNLYTLNVPLGMWFFTENNGNKFIELYKDMDTGFSQTWSLTISSQFKSFPYSQSMPSNMGTNYTTNAFSTFAQVLASQSELVNTFNRLTYSFEMVNQRLNTIETQIANMSTETNIDGLHKEMINYENKINNNFETLKDNVLSYLSYLRWKVTI